MNQLHSIMIVLAIVASVGVVNFLAQSANAWHAEFSSKKECRNAVIEATGNKTGEANRICERLIPHEQD